MNRTSNLIMVTGSHEKRTDSLTSLANNDQNIVIEAVRSGEDIPKSVEDLAVFMLDHDMVIRDIVKKLRKKIALKDKKFSISLANKKENEIKLIIDLFDNLIGVIASYYYSPKTKMLSGELVLSNQAKRFIGGDYMEIAVFKKTKIILDDLARKYNKTFALHRNVHVSTKNGVLKNEFDLIIDFAGVYFAIEIKSGDNFRDVEKYMSIGREYKIVPGRFLLVDNYYSNTKANIGSYFCGYYISNLSGNSYKDTLTKMIVNGMGCKNTCLLNVS